MSFLTLMNSTVDIQTDTPTKSATGGAVRNWLPKASAVACRVDQIAADTAVDYGRLGLTVTHRVYFPADHGLTISDRIVFGGAYYYVRAVNNAGGHIGHHWEADVERKSSL